MQILFGFIFFLIMVFFTWLLYTLARGDISKIFRWAKYLYFIILPVSLSMWIYESLVSEDWIELKRSSTIILLMNLIFVLLLLIGWVVFRIISNRKPRGVIGYGVSFYSKRIESTNNYGQQRIMMLLTLSLVINPVINMYFLVDFINSYFKF